MTTEEQKAYATAIHKMATEIVQSFHKQRNLHPPLTEVLPWFAEQMTQLAVGQLVGQLPTSTLEAAKMLYLTTIISLYTVDDVAAAYAFITAAIETNTVAE